MINELDMNVLSGLRSDTLSHKKWFRFSGKVWTALWKVTIVVIRSKLLSFPLAEFLSFFYEFIATKSCKIFRVSWKKCQGKSCMWQIFYSSTFFFAFYRVLKNRLKANVSQLSQQPNKAYSHRCWLVCLYLQLPANVPKMNVFRLSLFDKMSTTGKCLVGKWVISHIFFRSSQWTIANLLN